MSNARIIRRETDDVLRPQHTALIILDGAASADQEQISELIRAAHSKHILTVFVDYAPISEHFGVNGEGRTANLAAGLAGPDDYHIDRINYNCFYGNCLHDLLQLHHIETVVLCGGMTETTLYTSVCEAQYHDYYACVASDTISSFDPDISAAAIQLIKKRYRFLKAGEIIKIWNASEDKKEPETENAACTPSQKLLDPAHTALVIIDMQKDFCDLDGEYAKTRDVIAVRKIIPNIQALLASARENEVFVLFFRQITLRNNYADNGASIAFKTRDGKAATYALDGTIGQEYIDDIQIKEDEVVIPKLRSNGFHGTYADKVLRANNITTLVVTGTQTEGCVLSTMMGAEQHGFTVIPVMDAMETSVNQVQESALQFIKHRFPLAQTTDDILNRWNASTEQ